MAERESERGDFVVLAGERSGRAQAFAHEFARRGRQVVHVSPSLAVGADSWQPLGVDPADHRVHHIALPSELVQHAGAPWSGSDVVRAQEALACVIDGLGLRCPALLVQSAGWANVAGAMRELTDFPLVCDLPVADAMQVPRLVDASDVVLAASGPAAEQLRELHWNVVAVPDGCDAERWSEPSVEEASALRPPLNGPLIGYAGDGPLDARLLAALAELRPDWTFPVLGRADDRDLELLDRLANVHVLANVPADEIPRYATEFDVGLAPLHTTGAALERFPVEVLEMLAAGKPVVATAHPDLFGLQTAGVAVGVTPGELASAIERALAGGHDAEGGRAIAALQSWSERVDRFATAVEASQPSLDVVVVSYGNADVLGRCLRSIERDDSHDVQLIVVDNASGPETLTVLDEAEAAGAIVERLAVNEGFPAAVNRGVALGRGRYVLVLNDDVQLPAGGLRALVHALARARAVGLTGPATNSIANEARVDVPYDERHPPDEVVDAVHAVRSVLHAGEVFDVGVAALFAAIMRRTHFEAVGGLSERYQLGQFDDDDLSHRIRTQLGLRVVLSDDVFVHHAGMSAFGALDAQLLEGLFSRNRRVFERASRSSWQPHRLRDEPRIPDDPRAQRERHTMSNATERDPDLRVAELEEELRATRRDYQSKLGELAQRAQASNGGSHPPDASLYEMLLRLERERQDIHTGLHAEHRERLRVEAERDRLAAELEHARQQAALHEERARVLEASLAWRLGRVIIDSAKHLPLLRKVAKSRGA